jgi:hypothetical protein
MRFSRDESIQLREGWREELTQEQFQIFESACGDINRSYGYE